MYAVLTIEPNVLRVALAAFGVMIAGSLARLIALRRAAPAKAKERLDSLKSWWAVAIVILGAALLGRTAAVILFAAVSAAALSEFFALRRDAIGHRDLPALAYGLTGLSYVWIWLGWSQVFIAFLPLAGLLVLSTRMVLLQRTSGFTREVAQTYWGLLLAAYAPAYAVLLFTLPVETNAAAGGAGWFLFLLLLTETGDIAQAHIGRRIGRRKLAPVVSPHKTWEGLAGGIAVAMLLAVLLARPLTPWSPATAVAAGVFIPVVGLFGDLNISAIKRDAGVKDSSQLLPGQGGILDRIDSLTFAAPLFYYFVVLTQPVNATGTG